MILPRRAPREVYRVYREDEFMAASDCAESNTDRAASATESRGLRAAGPLALIGLCGAVAAIVVLNEQRSARPRAGRALARPSSAAKVSRAPVDRRPRRRTTEPREHRVPPRTPHRHRAAPRLPQRARPGAGGHGARRSPTPENPADLSQGAALHATPERVTRRAAGAEFGFER